MSERAEQLWGVRGNRKLFFEMYAAHAAEGQEVMKCGHQRMFWVVAKEGTPTPTPTKSFKDRDICEYCGSPLGHCPEGEYCTNKNCGYVDGYYVERKSERGHCTICSSIATAIQPYKDAVADLNSELEAHSTDRVKQRAEVAAYKEALRWAIGHVKAHCNFRTTIQLERLASAEALLNDPGAEREEESNG